MTVECLFRINKSYIRMTIVKVTECFWFVRNLNIVWRPSAQRCEIVRCFKVHQGENSQLGAVKSIRFWKFSPLLFVGSKTTCNILVFAFKNKGFYVIAVKIRSWILSIDKKPNNAKVRNLSARDGTDDIHRCRSRTNPNQSIRLISQNCCSIEYCRVVVRYPRIPW